MKRTRVIGSPIKPLVNKLLPTQVLPAEGVEQIHRASMRSNVATHPHQKTRASHDASYTWYPSSLLAEDSGDAIKPFW